MASPVASHYVHRSEHYGAIRKTVSIKFCVLSPEIPGDEEVYIFHRFGFLLIDCGTKIVAHIRFGKRETT